MSQEIGLGMSRSYLHYALAKDFSSDCAAEVASAGLVLAPLTTVVWAPGINNDCRL